MQKLKYIIIIFIITSSLNLFSEEASALSRGEEAKANGLAVAIQAPPDLTEEIEKVTHFVQSHWQEWMQNRNFDEIGCFIKKRITDLTTVTIHPNEQEVCLYIAGHTKEVGRGAFKRVYRGLSYTKEEEIAVAIPFQTKWSEENASSIDDSIPYTSDPNESTYSDFSWIEDELHEARMLEAVKGVPGILQVYSIAYPRKKRGALPVIIGKYYRGGDFYDAISTRTLSLDEAKTIAHDLLVGLCAVHARLTVHRDLHGGNVLIDIDPVTDRVRGGVISDFGCAKQYDDPNSKSFLRNVVTDSDNLYALLGQLFHTLDTGEREPFIEFFDLASEKGWSANKTLKKFKKLRYGHGTLPHVRG